AHVAFYDGSASRVEMHLVPDAPQLIHVRGLGLTVRIAAGEGIWTESCYKFTRHSVATILEEAGLRLAAWHVDPGHYFALAMAAPAGDGAGGVCAAPAAPVLRSRRFDRGGGGALRPRLGGRRAHADALRLPRQGRRACGDPAPG